MRFKDSTELPPPRYALDDEEDEFIVSTTYDLQVDGNIEDIDRLLVVAPRVIGLRGELSRSLLATINLTIHNSTPATQAQDFEGWDVVIEESTQNRSVKFSVHSGPKGVAVLALPLLDEAQAAYCAKALVSRMPKLQNVIVATPGTIYDGTAVCHISTSHCNEFTDSLVPGCEPAVPPVVVQGAAAAFLSNCEQRGIAAIGYVVNSDGPLNHEAIQPAHYEALRRVLHHNLGLNSATAPEISTLYV